MNTSCQWDRDDYETAQSIYLEDPIFIPNTWEEPWLYNDQVSPLYSAFKRFKRNR